jgi:phosphomannomutase/phosphoglucomutase
MADLIGKRRLGRRLRVVVACGNGTAGAFAPRVLEGIGAEVTPLDVELDYRFPHYNPNPEDLRMLSAVADKVRATRADVGLALDGDGDRCGAVDNTGAAVFADKIGLLLAREIAAEHGNARFVVDVKSTALFRTDPVLSARGASVEYWKTGHSYMKRRVSETKAIAGFEKSGHYFFAPPLGRGYDDGLLSAILILEALDRHEGAALADLVASLPRTWSSPTMSAHCADEAKYAVADAVQRRLEQMRAERRIIDGHGIAELITVNGVRAVMDDGTWGLVRASSNKPELVVVVESPVSEDRMRAMFRFLDALMRESDGVGDYNQRL